MIVYWELYSFIRDTDIMQLINGEFLNIAIIYQNAMRGVNKEIEM